MSDYIPADSVPLVAHKTGVAQGRALERALIVAWLADIGLEIAAGEIKDGEHLK